MFIPAFAGRRPTGAVRRRRRRRESRIPCDRRERRMVRRATVGSATDGTAPQGKVARSVREAPEWGFRGPPDTTLLPLLSGASDAGAEAPITARRSCPGCPAAQSGRWQGAASAGRAASTLTPGNGRLRGKIQRPGRIG